MFKGMKMRLNIYQMGP